MNFPSSHSHNWRSSLQYKSVTSIRILITGSEILDLGTMVQSLMGQLLHSDATKVSKSSCEKSKYGQTFFWFDIWLLRTRIGTLTIGTLDSGLKKKLCFRRLQAPGTREESVWRGAGIFKRRLGAQRKGYLCQIGMLSVLCKFVCSYLCPFSFPVPVNAFYCIIRPVEIINSWLG